MHATIRVDGCTHYSQRDAAQRLADTLNSAIAEDGDPGDVFRVVASTIPGYWHVELWESGSFVGSV